MYAISDITTYYFPKSNNFSDAWQEVHKFADKLAKDKGFVNYRIWTAQVYGGRWNIEITNND